MYRSLKTSIARSPIFHDTLTHQPTFSGLKRLEYAFTELDKDPILYQLSCVMASDPPNIKSKSKSKSKSEAYTPDLARVRDNQRRARARQRDYLQELEARLQKYEKQGIQATIEVQSAARAVAKENERLREENTRLLDEILQLRKLVEPGTAAIERASGIDSRATGSASRSLCTAPSSVTLGLLQEGSKELESSSCGAPHAGGDWGRPSTYLQPRTLQSPSYITSADDTAPSLGCSVGHHYNRSANVEGLSPQDTNNVEAYEILQSHRTNNCPTATRHQVALPSLQSPPTTAPSTEDRSLPSLNEVMAQRDDTSSCEHAAHIIASMRTDLSADDIRAELGCGSDVVCKVDNAKLFVAFDRYTG